MPDNADPKPTIDGRIDAIAQSLGLTAAMQRDNEERWQKRFGEIAESIRGPARIAEIH